MASVVFYFQVHQPYRLRRYTIFDNEANYFDDRSNEMICRKVADKCYLPANRAIAEHFDDNFFPHGHTYEAHPLTLAPAIAAIDEYKRLDLINRSRDTRANARALAQFEFIVVNDQFLTPTAAHEACGCLHLCTFCTAKLTHLWTYGFCRTRPQVSIVYTLCISFV